MTSSFGPQRGYVISSRLSVPLEEAATPQSLRARSVKLWQLERQDYTHPTKSQFSLRGGFSTLIDYRSSPVIKILVSDPLVHSGCPNYGTSTCISWHIMGMQITIRPLIDEMTCLQAYQSWKMSTATSLRYMNASALILI